jgi:hypothetical protein
VTWLYWAHFIFLAALIVSIMGLVFLARVHDRD